MIQVLPCFKSTTSNIFWEYKYVYVYVKYKCKEPLDPHTRYPLSQILDGTRINSMDLYREMKSSTSTWILVQVQSVEKAKTSSFFKNKNAKKETREGPKFSYWIINKHIQFERISEKKYQILRVFCRWLAFFSEYFSDYLGIW